MAVQPCMEGTPIKKKSFFDSVICDKCIMSEKIFKEEEILKILVNCKYGRVPNKYIITLKNMSEKIIGGYYY